MSRKGRRRRKRRQQKKERESKDATVDPILENWVSVDHNPSNTVNYETETFFNRLLSFVIRSP